ncbi:MAG: hypothetical protein ACI8S6_003621 [Myxococcota bacterium]|jgi:hypothetical protein
MLWIKAMQHLQVGVSLEHGGTLLSTIPGDPSRFRITGPGSEPVEHTQVMVAIEVFIERVGKRGLGHAIGKSRYAALFPNGSSLDWDLAAPQAAQKRAC